MSPHFSCSFKITISGLPNHETPSKHYVCSKPGSTSTSALRLMTTYLALRLKEIYKQPFSALNVGSLSSKIKD